MKITATVKYIERDKVPCPRDGVHRVGKDGSIKGVHSLWFDDKLVPKGQTAFYWRTGENTGRKIYYSFGWMKPLKLSMANHDANNLRRLAKVGVSPQTYGMEQVYLKLLYKTKVIQCKAWSLEVDHVHYPEDAWEAYAKGHPYDWDADDDDDHTPPGFLRFVAHAKRQARKAKARIDTSWKLGDVVWCMKKHEWFLVDGGR